MQRKKNHAEEKRHAFEQQQKNDTWVLDDDETSLYVVVYDCNHQWRERERN
jgi:hypothetical protein